MPRLKTNSKFSIHSGIPQFFILEYFTQELPRLMVEHLVTSRPKRFLETSRREKNQAVSIV